MVFPSSKSNKISVEDYLVQKVHKFKKGEGVLQKHKTL